MVLIGLGSNRGDCQDLVRSAMQALAVFSRSEFRCSSLWHTSPVDCPPDSAAFINAVVAFTPLRDLTPLALLRQLKDLERKFGRAERTVKNAPRELDLDLLVFDDICMADDVLELPHPRAAERRFVLAPALEVAPDLCWPGTGKTVWQLHQSLRSDEAVRKICAQNAGGRNYGGRME